MIVKDIDFVLLSDAWRYGMAHPDNFDMSIWASRAGSLTDEEIEELQRDNESPVVERALKDQTVCGTTGCLAGTILFLRGYKFIFDEDDVDTALAESPDGEQVDIELRAIDLLHNFKAERKEWEHCQCGCEIQKLFYKGSLSEIRQEMIESYGIDPKTYGLPEHGLDHG